MGACSVLLGVWLCVVVIHNSNLKPENQIYFEKVSIDEGGSIGHDGGGAGGNFIHLQNESPFTHTPVDNLCFYLLTLSFVTILGGCGRIITTTFFCVHFCKKVIFFTLFSFSFRFLTRHINLFTVWIWILFTSNLASDMYVHQTDIDVWIICMIYLIIKSIN